MMDWMKPSRTHQLPLDEKNWVYEMKYDGYRTRLHWNGSTVQLISKSGHELKQQFPEIQESILQCFSEGTEITLDGELAILENNGKADFYHLQRRHRLRAMSSIKKEAHTLPAVFLAFDCFSYNNTDIRKERLETRKGILKSFFEEVKLPLSPSPHHNQRIQLLPFYERIDDLLEENLKCCGEGIVAKRKQSLYEKGRTSQWVKYKTPFDVPCFITSYDPENKYFHLGVLNKNHVQPIGKCAHGFSYDELEALIHTVKHNGDWNIKEKQFIIDPSIVVEVNYTTRKKEELREPRFSRFRLDLSADHCTVERLREADLRFPPDVHLTHPDKSLWPDQPIQKIDFLQYVRQAAPYVLPYVMNRPLTVIRFPHGMYDEGFFQKECPDYAPDYVKTTNVDGNNYILCQNVRTLLWLANQLAIEWHVPFQLYNSTFVHEIVFDLDPPNTDYFDLAIEGALLLKELCDSFDLVSFVKFSGNKGLQIHVPLPEDQYTWEDTPLITEAFGAFLTKKHPELFTQERLKKNRDNKLYIDIPQHRKGKTIISPYSLRGKDLPLIACPLSWEEVDGSLNRENFTMSYTLERLRKSGCPFKEMEQVRGNQPIDQLLHLLNNTSFKKVERRR